MNEDTALPTYALRVMPRAEQDILVATQYIADAAGETAAQEWQDGLFAAIASLATLPRRCALAREERLFQREVRQLVFRKSAGGAAYRVLFRVTDSEQDAPTIFILHVRHGAQSPITRAEAHALEATEE